MGEIKKYVLLSVLLLGYIYAVSLLLQSFFVYQKAYQSLSRLVSHPTIETIYTDPEKGEE